jgi:hypothetical protein
MPEMGGIYWLILHYGGLVPAAWLDDDSHNLLTKQEGEFARTLPMQGTIERVDRMVDETGFEVELHISLPAPLNHHAIPAWEQQAKLKFQALLNETFPVPPTVHVVRIHAPPPLAQPRTASFFPVALEVQTPGQEIPPDEGEDVCVHLHVRLAPTTVAPLVKLTFTRALEQAVQQQPIVAAAIASITIAAEPDEEREIYASVWFTGTEAIIIEQAASRVCELVTRALRPLDPMATVAYRVA